MRKEPAYMITVQHLYGLIILNLVVLCGLFLLCKLSKKASSFGELLLAACWLVFSWYYQLRFSGHLPASIHHAHPFLEMFVTVIYGFGCWLSIMLTFTFAVVSVGQILHPEESSEKKVSKRMPNHSPWPLWIAGLLTGLLSSYVLKASLIPGLNKLMDWITELIYGTLFHMRAQFPASYLPAAGIAAGTVAAACFTHAYRRSKVPFLYFLSLILVPALTAVLAPLADLAGTILVLIFVFAAFQNRNVEAVYPRRSAIPFVLSALVIGGLSSLYFYLYGPGLVNNDRGLFIVGGIVSGFTIACLGFKSYMCENNRFRSLYYWGLIPYCSLAFGFFVEYIICLVGAFILLGAGIQSMHSGRAGDRIELWTENSNPVYYMGHGKITFLEHGETVEAYESALYMDTYLGNNGKKYEINGNSLDSV